MQAMNLTVLPIGGPYSLSASELLFRYCVSFAERGVVRGPMRITGYLLVNVNDDLIMVGGSSSILRVSGEPIEVGPDVPLLAIVNVLDDPDDRGVLIPGLYELHAGVLVDVPTTDGRVKSHELRANCIVEIT